MIESIQYNATLANTGCIRGTLRDKKYNELGLMSLYDRRNYRRLTFFYKIYNDMSPNYLNLLIPDEDRQITIFVDVIETTFLLELINFNIVFFLIA